MIQASGPRRYTALVVSINIPLLTVIRRALLTHGESSNKQPVRFVKVPKSITLKCWPASHYWEELKLGYRAGYRGGGGEVWLPRVPR